MRHLYKSSWFALGTFAVFLAFSTCSAYAWTKQQSTNLKVSADFSMVDSSAEAKKLLYKRMPSEAELHRILFGTISSKKSTAAVSVKQAVQPSMNGLAKPKASR